MSLCGAVEELRGLVSLAGHKVKGTPFGEYDTMGKFLQLGNRVVVKERCPGRSWEWGTGFSLHILEICISNNIQYFIFYIQSPSVICTVSRIWLIFTAWVLIDRPLSIFELKLYRESWSNWGSHLRNNKKLLPKDQRCRPEGGHWLNCAVKSTHDLGNTWVFYRESQRPWGGKNGKSLTFLWSNIMRAQIVSFRNKGKCSFWQLERSATSGLQTNKFF